MLVMMRRVGVVMYLKFHWVNRSVVLYTLLDNGGRHGTDVCIAQYTEMLRAEFDIILIYQVPRSPYCNFLDLGSIIYRCKSKIQYMKRYNIENIVRSVYHT